MKARIMNTNNYILYNFGENISIKIKKSDLAIIYAGFALILCGVLAGCQNPVMGLDIGTPATSVDTGPVINGWYGGDPVPSIALYWDGNEVAERTGDTIIWPAFDLGTRTPVTVTKTALAVFKNPPAGFEYLQWTFETDTNAKADASEDGLLAFGDAWHPGAQDTGLSEMPINAGLGVTEAKITVWNCDSTGTRGTVSAFFILKVVEFGTPIPPTLKISWDGDKLSHNNETLTWWKSSGPLSLTAAITDPPAGPTVRWTISGPADVVVFDGYTAGNPVSPADAVKIKTGTNFGTETVTVTAALEGYPEVTESFTIIPGPTLEISWDGDKLSHNNETLTWWKSSGPLDLTAVITNPPNGPQVRWSISSPADVVVFDGYTAGNLVSPADAVKIKTGANFGTDTVTVTAALEGYPGVTESFTITPGPTLKISWDGDKLSHNNETLTWRKGSGPLSLTAAITNPPAGPQVRWTINGPADAVVFDGYTAGDPVSPADAVKIKTGANFGTDTVTVTAALEGYPEVTESFTIIPNPTLQISWDGDKLSHNNETLTWWKSSGPLDLTAAITNPPSGPQVRWTINGPANAVVFDGYTAGNLVSPADAVKIKPGVNFGTDTVTVTAVLEGYPEVTESFTIIPGPTVSNFTTVPGGYTGSAFITYYNSTATLDVTVNAAGELEYASGVVPTGAVKSLTLTGPALAGGNKTHLIGRAMPSSLLPIVLKLGVGGGLEFRSPMGGSIPIGSYAEFQLINTAPGGKYKQETDLDLMDVEWTPVGSSGSQFTGIFDGEGKTLSNLKIEKTGDDNVGLFGVVGSGGEVKSVGILSGSVKGRDNVGGLAGSSSGDIINSYNNAAVNGTNNVGGLAGSTSGGTITASYNNAEVTAQGSNGGGLVGSTGGDITACYSTGAVKVNGHNVGGLAGSMSGGNITDCYTTGNLTGSSAGGLVPMMVGNVSFCYWDNNIRSGSGGGGSGSGGGSKVTPTGSGFTPVNTNGNWGTGDGSGPGKYWKPNTVNGQDGKTGLTTLPKLWFE
ncbi:hypothetical protein AGMMS50255_4400 [Spirochaetia bacterium]|nr:hypothetical protein AGMMS50255_4400 [Spirochaetia bacterium]